ncbi:retrovirus-related pol polyprotein from transposon RE2 [Citrus sinensis]|nr:retrovirus-related pol polyprotein from transposon RE2 [Citrus sinensis]
MSHNSQHSSSSTSIVPIPQPSVPAHVPLPTHPMVTRAKAGIFKPKFLAYSSVLEEHEPATISQALSNPKWKAAMQAEYDALMKNETWVLVPASQATKVVGCKWVFRIKYNADGSISEYKARLVANGFHQTPGIDYFGNFSLVVKQSTMRIVLSLAVMKSWKIRQIDINNAFLNGQLNEDAPRAWFDRLRKALLKWGFQNSRTDSSLFFKHELGGIVVVLVYVDEILITVDNNTVIERFIKYLGDTFALKDLGEFNYFLGIEVTQEKYWTACKRILRYLKATEDYGLLFKPGGGVVLTAYTDADWACDVDDRKSVGAYCVYLGQNLISWSSEKQQTIARSST